MKVSVVIYYVKRIIIIHYCQKKNLLQREAYQICMGMMVNDSSRTSFIIGYNLHFSNISFVISVLSEHAVYNSSCMLVFGDLR